VRRVSVVGNSGSGKTTLGKDLAGRLGVPFVELDAINHQPGWRELDVETFRVQVEAALLPDGWVVDGNYRGRIGDVVVSKADTVVWLDYRRRVVIARIVRRTLRRVVTRQELWNGNREPWSNLWSRDPARSVIAWSWAQHDAYRRRYEAESSAAPPSQRWVRLRTPAETARWLSGVSPAAASS